MAARQIGVVLAFALFVLPAAAQEARPGVGVDSRGSPVIDPTENVKALNAAEAKRQDDLRNMEARFQNAARESETRRLNDLAAQKQLFDLELARVLKGNVDSSALLLSTALKELKTDSNERVTKLEQRAYESSGRGAGLGDAFGYVMAVIMTIIAAAALFWKRAH